MRTLGLDIGTRRIGVAISDPMGWTAQPLETVQVHRSGTHLERIAAICQELGVGEIVAGVPFEMDGQAGFSARRVRQVLQQVGQETSLPVHEVDERLTTRQAERALLEADMRRKQRKSVIDQMAASLILQAWLDQKRGSS